MQEMKKPRIWRRLVLGSSVTDLRLTMIGQAKRRLGCRASSIFLDACELWNGCVILNVTFECLVRL